MKQILVVNGPNLNLLGKREPEKYGASTLEEINAALTARAAKLGAACLFFQSNSEGDIVTAIQGSDGLAGVILNAGAYTHYSIAIRDAIASISAPVIEVHITNIYSREEFRRHSVLSAVCTGTITGLGPIVYALALEALAGES